jgi:hypothetical protein
MSVLEQFQNINTVRTKIVEIEGIQVLFREPALAEHNKARRNFMKYTLVQKNGTPKNKITGNEETEQETVFDSDRSDMSAYHRELVMMTAHDPDTNDRVFPDIKAFNSLFGIVNGEMKHGEGLFNKFVEHAQDVLRPESQEGAEKN